MTQPPPSPDPQLEPLTRMQVLAAMGLTAVVLLLIAKTWLYFDPAELMPLELSLEDGLLGMGLGLAITAASSVTYRLWPAYRHSADTYLLLVLEPLQWPDLIWLGLLPGLSEELLFRGVMLPAIGMNGLGIVVSAASFGVLHLSSLQQWTYVVWATTIGLVLATSTVLTGNLLVPIVAHTVTNLVSSAMWKFRQQQPAA
ncbi:CPBP family intramembrane glutamic endopeptidase [Nodosilinea sp. E11]|uniref:CPBP family intramembrane glutamic endopeptidase n=1 Tax=Nodosilinea sp. E11 TaxID=3037479 RepID=UPI0029351A0B|nr:CPBP family intramembrane glutamic endopeptidase [Nodosilinea sp. E11]WOD38974.1 CPBP family intramembrane glutamic endopeptidase [Nodosilinea sp. E11]